MSIILGIESTAHTFGVGIVRDGKIIANVKRSYTTNHGGIVPLDAAKHHQENKNEIYFEALNQAEIEEGDINAIAFSQGPGLSPCLLEGMKFAKYIAGKLKKSLIPVNHCIAHLEIGGSIKDGPKDPVMLYVSGANTQIIAYASGKYRIFGETLDIGVGNFIDSFARLADLGFPGGAKIEKLAKKSKKYVELPYKVKGMDIALSGILTNLKQKIEKIKLPAHSDSQINKKLLTRKDKLSTTFQQKTDFSLTDSEKYRASDSEQLHNITSKTGVRLRAERDKYTLANLAYSMQETVFAMLVETAERALAHTGKNELLLGGGVACNSRLQEMCKIMCKERGAKFFCPSNDLLVDNGAMIAYTGEILFNNRDYVKIKDIDKIDIKPRQRTDEIEVRWRNNNTY